jgi:uncharacterized membrane protein
VSVRGERSGRALAGLTAGAPYLFLLFSLVSTLFLAWNLPPFQGADELAHIDRALIGASGRVVGERIVKGDRIVAGGEIETGVYTASEPFDNIRFNVPEKADAIDYAQAIQHRWGGPTFIADFRGSAMYPPFFYAPSSIAFAIGRAIDQPIIQTLYMARAAQALVCCFIGFLALMLAGRSRLLLYGVLLLPMSMGLYSALGNDGLLIATTALGCALICRALSQGRPMSGREIVAAAACFALVGMTKVPYALFGLIFLAVDAARPAWRWRATAAVLAASIGWFVLTALTVQLPLHRADIVIDPAGQVAFLLGDPLVVFDVAYQTLTTNWRPYSEAFVGVLGWLDTFLPKPYYPLALTLLTLAALGSASSAWPREWRRLPWTALLIVLGVFSAIHAALYVSWNAVGVRVIEGVAGRYFLPLVCFLSLALEGSRPLIPDTIWGRRARLGLTVAVLAFPLLSLLIVQRAIILRYYLD